MPWASNSGGRRTALPTVTTEAGELSLRVRSLGMYRVSLSLLSTSPAPVVNIKLIIMS